MSAFGRAFVMLHLALHLAYLILQLPARALEGIVERVVDVRITLLVESTGAVDGSSAPSRPRGRR